MRAIDPAQLTPETITRRLRHWAAGQDAHVIAAVELLAVHDLWLRRPDFHRAAVRATAGPAQAWIIWRAAREAFNAGQLGPASTTELAVLDLAIALGEDRYRLAAMGTGNAAAIATAVALAAGLVDPSPEGIHNR